MRLAEPYAIEPPVLRWVTPPGSVLPPLGDALGAPSCHQNYLGNSTARHPLTDDTSLGSTVGNARVITPLLGEATGDTAGDSIRLSYAACDSTQLDDIAGETGDP